MAEELETKEIAVETRLEKKERLKLEKKRAKEEERKKYEERVIAYNNLAAREIKNRRLEKVAPKDVYISLRNINKIYDNLVQAVYDFNIDIQKNEFIVFVGPSGCGKSTTLRMIAGLEEITAGDLFIDGVYANPLPPKDREITMVFQSYALYPHMTVHDNLAFALKTRHYPKEIIEERIAKAAKILQIEEYLDRKPKALSGGQRQRVALGRAIVRQAKVFLMDEPLSNLDAKLRVSMRSEIIKLHKEIGATTIYVTHDQTEAMTMADRIVVMSKGYVQQIGTPEEIYNHPQNEFVANFIGSPSMNIIRTKYNKGNIELNGQTILSLTPEQKEVIHQYFKDKIAVIDTYEKEGFEQEKATQLIIKKYNFEVDFKNMKKNEIKYYKNAIAQLTKDGGDAQKIATLQDQLQKVHKIASISKAKKAKEAELKAQLAEIEEKIKLNQEEKNGETVAKDIELGDKLQQQLSEIQYKITNVHQYTDFESTLVDIVLTEEEEAVCKQIYEEKLLKQDELRKQFKDILTNDVFDVDMGIRPEDCYLSTASLDSSVKASKPVAVKLNIKELLGNEYYLHCLLNDTEFTFKSKASETFNEGETRELVFDLNKVHLFNIIDKNRIF